MTAPSDADTPQRGDASGTERRRAATMKKFALMMLRASLLRPDLYAEVEKDRNATLQAYVVVVMGGLCDGIGSVGLVGAQGLLTGVLAGVIGWFLWSLVIYLIGVKVFEHPSDMGELLRCTGFAYSPSVLRLLGVIPVAGIYLRAMSTVWIVAAFVVAVKQALDCSWGRAVFIVVQGLMVFLIVFILISLNYILF